MSKVSPINNIAKKSLLGALFVGAVALKASSPIQKTTNPISKEAEKTEIVSRNGAEALRASLVPPQTQNNQVSCAPNNRIANKYRKYAENSRERANAENLIEGTYKYNGTFLGTVHMQHYTDLCQLALFLNGNNQLLIDNNINPALGNKVKNFGPDFFKSVKPVAKELKKWAFENYSKFVLQAFSYDHIPTGEEVEMDLLQLVKNMSAISSTEKAIFAIKSKRFLKEFLKELEKYPEDKSYSDFLAYEIHLLDKIILNKVLENYGVYGVNSFTDGQKTLSDYFDDWMKSVEPSAK